MSHRTRWISYSQYHNMYTGPAEWSTIENTIDQLYMDRYNRMYKKLRYWFRRSSKRIVLQTT